LTMTTSYQNKRAQHVLETESSDLQTATELECAPFFVDLTTLSEGQLDHLRGVGLLPPKIDAGLGHAAATRMCAKAADMLGVSESADGSRSVDENDDADDDERIVILEEIRGDQKRPTNNSNRQDPRNINIQKEEEERHSPAVDPYAIRLLRSQHVDYLTHSLSNPLSKGFVSLDASHPWMVYWILHSLDLLGHFDLFSSFTSNANANAKGDMTMREVEAFQKADLLTRVVSTLSHCWSGVCVEFSSRDVQGDDKLRELVRSQEITNKERNKDSGDGTVTIIGGGFGGGPSQMPHCAPTYAAVLALSIVTGIGLADNSSGKVRNDESEISTNKINQNNRNPYREAGELALNLLSEKRLPLYAFFLSLRERQGTHDDEEDERIAFRMHHDGEIDVRASYCILAPCKLLGLIDETAPTSSEKKINHAKGDTSSIISSNPLLAPSIAKHISACQTHEGGFGAEPHNEAHGGYTFCALASLRILNAVEEIDVDNLRGWLARRQMGYEGGFCGRTNKLVDGCYSFWQGGAMAVLDEWDRGATEMKGGGSEMIEGEREKKEEEYEEELDEEEEWERSEISFDEIMLQRYILLCAQDVNGGLRDKPSKPRDFYHTCYNLSGLSVAQHSSRLWLADDIANESGDDSCLNRIFGDVTVNIVGRTDPVLNIRVERVEVMLSQHF